MNNRSNENKNKEMNARNEMKSSARNQGDMREITNKGDMKNITDQGDIKNKYR